MAYERAVKFCWRCYDYSQKINDTKGSLPSNAGYKNVLNSLTQQLAIYYQGRDSATKEALITLEQEDQTNPKIKSALEVCLKCGGKAPAIRKVLFPKES